MIHEFARCPFCNRGVLAVDDAGPSFVFEPDRPNGGACPHLALATVCFSADANKPRGSFVTEKVWRWSHGNGLQGPDAGGDELGDYLTDLACDGLPYPQLVPKVPYRLVGVYASEREDRHKGWGYFAVASDKGLLEGSINGWALYTRSPAALIRDIHKRPDLWTRMSAAESTTPRRSRRRSRSNAQAG